MPRMTHQADEALADGAIRAWLGEEATRTPVESMNGSVWLVETAAGRYVLKVARPEDAPGLDVATALDRAGISTGAPIRRAEQNGRLVALLRFVDGSELTVADARLVGSTLAQIHTALLDVDVPTLDRWPWTFLDPSAIRETRLRFAAQQAIDGAHRVASSLTHGPLHGDPAPEAFLRSADGVALIDWGAALHGPLLYDVASAVMYAGPLVVDGYSQRSPLAEPELEHIDAFLAFRWAVQAWYFSDRIKRGDLSGVSGPSDNDVGLADSRRALLGKGS